MYLRCKMPIKKRKDLPIVVMTVTEYSNASLNDQRGKRSPIVSINPPFVAATIEPSKRLNCSCTNRVQFRSYKTLRRSVNI